MFTEAEALADILISLGLAQVFIFILTILGAAMGYTPYMYALLRALLSGGSAG